MKNSDHLENLAFDDRIIFKWIRYAGAGAD
jgi:hypothetical protein